jgi:predicted ribosome quality control (RQC) complex YloA/Tae2 family protein
MNQTTFHHLKSLFMQPVVPVWLKPYRTLICIFYALSPVISNAAAIDAVLMSFVQDVPTYYHRLQTDDLTTVAEVQTWQVQQSIQVNETQAQLTQACYQRFVVSSCLDEVRRVTLKVNQTLDALKISANQREREIKAYQRQQSRIQTESDLITDQPAMMPAMTMPTINMPVLLDPILPMVTPILLPSIVIREPLSEPPSTLPIKLPITRPINTLKPALSVPSAQPQSEHQIQLHSDTYHQKITKITAHRAKKERERQEALREQQRKQAAHTLPLAPNYGYRAH